MSRQNEQTEKPKQGSRARQEKAMRERGYITVRECARRLHQSLTPVYRAMDSGDLRWVTVGKRRYIEEASFREWAGPLAEQP